MKESRLYSFLDSKKGFSLHFLEGTKLINNIMAVHSIGPHASNYFKKTLLTAQHMLNFLKAGESLGVYIDSDSPYYRFKIEMSSQGTMRTLLLPEEFNDFPEKITGLARVTKIFPSQAPYTSIVQLLNTPVYEVINKILNESYQTNSHISISAYKDQSLMMTKLPPIKVDKEGNPEDDKTMEQFQDENHAFFEMILNNHMEDIERIVKTFEEKNFNYLGSKEVKFFCPCSKNRMINNLLNLHHNDLNEVFGDDSKIEIRCDYCNALYEISKNDLSSVH